MTSELAFIAALRALATDPAARGLMDDAAVLEVGAERLVLTMDALVEGVHFLPDDPPADIAWKLIATNVSDLSAKGAQPKGCLLTYALAPDGDWDAAFSAGLAEACTHFAIPLLGGDTVRSPAGSARSFSLTAIGAPPTGAPVPSRAGAQPGDTVWVSGCIGDAGMGLKMLLGEVPADPVLVSRYRRPMPNPALGVALAPHASAMMDVSDGLLIDAGRMAAASQVAITIEAMEVPLSPELRRQGDGIEARIAAMTAGDDYVLLFTAPASAEASLLKGAATAGGAIHRVGAVADGIGLTITQNGSPHPLPARLGYEH